MVRSITKTSLSIEPDLLRSKTKLIPHRISCLSPREEPRYLLLANYASGHGG